MKEIPPVLVGGEALYDLISTDPGTGLAGTTTFVKRAGGSPFNIAVAIRRLDVPVSFLGKIGSDQFGDGLIKFLEKELVTTDQVIRESGTKTTLAFVAVDRAGKVDFSFYRDHAADVSLTVHEVRNLEPAGFSILHCGGIVLAEDPTASAYRTILERFAEARVPVSLDPTIRLSLISDAERYRAFLKTLIRRVNILKVSDEELAFLSGTKEVEKGVTTLELPARALVIVTIGKEGALLFRDGLLLCRAEGFRVQVVETTGCGDSFMGAMLAQLAGRTLEQMENLLVADLEPMLLFANAEAAIVAGRYGAAEANPTRAEVEEFLAKQGK
jgi:fructokinase